MGSLILPATGPVYADANILIYTVQRHPVYFALLQPLWKAAQTALLEVLGSELLILETLVGPLRAGDTALQIAFEQALFASDLHLVSISQAVLREAARIRAIVPAVRAPDALHGATALLHGCTLFLTNDNGFKRVPGLTVAVLDDVLAAP